MNYIFLFSIMGAFVAWLIGWIIVDKYGNLNSKVSFIFKWFDLWIGFFYDTKKHWLYIFPLPCFGIIIKIKR